MAEAARWRWSELLGLAAIALGLILLWRIPGIGWAAYPFRLFSTFVHELSHGLAALATGGSFHRFVVETDLSGVAWTSGGVRWLVASAGYVGSAVFGGVLMVLVGWGVGARLLLCALGIVFGALCLLFISNAFGMVAGVVLASGLLLAGVWLRSPWSDLLLIAFALQAVLDGFNSLLNVFALARGADVHTDAHTLAQLSGLPAPLWVAVWTAFSAAALLLALRMACRGSSEERR